MAPVLSRPRGEPSIDRSLPPVQSSRLMRSGSWSKVLWMAALLPLFAASVLPTQLRTLICRVTGAVMEVDACCPAAPAAPAQAAARISESISDPGCCAVQTVDLGRMLAEHRSEEAPPPSVTPVSAAPMAGPVLAAWPTPSVRQDRPPQVGPPLLLLKRSFLI